MNSKEKKCLSEATTFMNESMAQIKLEGDRLLGQSVIIAGGTMIGQISSQKYKDCMDRPAAAPARPVVVR